MKEEEDPTLKEFTDAADVIQASMDMWAEEFDRWADHVEELEQCPSVICRHPAHVDDMHNAAKNMNYALKRMRREQAEAAELNNKINNHIIEKRMRGDLDDE